MSLTKSNLFTLAHTFLREPAQKVIPELKQYGFSGINLALNYHSSRDLLLRQGPQLEYLADGFHYYKSDFNKYPNGALKPDLTQQLPNNDLINSVIKIANSVEFEVNAWAVYLHNSAIGRSHPEVVVTNVFGNRFLSELCPSNPQVIGYISGLTRNLCDLGVSGIRAESLHFHGARHGEHHERFFIELSQISEFLFALCFCKYCRENYQTQYGDVDRLEAAVAKNLMMVFEDSDPWLGIKLTKEKLSEIIGPEIINYLAVRENSVTNLYQVVRDITKASKVYINFVDQAPLLEFESDIATQNSWQVGIDNTQNIHLVDKYEPLIYRKSVDQVLALAKDYLRNVTQEITAILRPTFPDCTSFENLERKIIGLNDLGVREIDFYLLDTMRNKDIKNLQRFL
jgi:hypothetical protein